MARRRSAWHRDLMDGYYAAREAWERQAEAVTHGYETEMREYRQENPPPTFREWLVGNRRQEVTA